MNILFYFKSDIYYKHLWHLYANKYIDEVLILVKFGVISKFNGVVCTTVRVLLLFVGIDKVLFVSATSFNNQIKMAGELLKDWISLLIFVSALGT